MYDKVDPDEILERLDRIGKMLENLRQLASQYEIKFGFKHDSFNSLDISQRFRKLLDYAERNMGRINEK